MLLDWGVARVVSKVREIQDESVVGVSTLSLLASCEYRNLEVGPDWSRVRMIGF